MREILVPPLRAAAFAAFIAGCLLLFLNPPSFAHLGGLMTIFAGAVAIMLWLLVRFPPRRRGPHVATPGVPPTAAVAR